MQTVYFNKWLWLCAYWNKPRVVESSVPFSSFLFLKESFICCSALRELFASTIIIFNLFQIWPINLCIVYQTFRNYFPASGQFDLWRQLHSFTVGVMGSFNKLVLWFRKTLNIFDIQLKLSITLFLWNKLLIYLF